MPERLILLLAVAALVATAILATRAWTARRIQTIQQRDPAWDALGLQPDGHPTLIAFSTPSCAACHTAQAPAIDLATQRLADVRVVKVDAAERPEVASAFGILTVPSTVILAARGHQIVAVNQGFTTSTRLVEQLQRA